MSLKSNQLKEREMPKRMKSMIGKEPREGNVEESLLYHVAIITRGTNNPLPYSKCWVKSMGIYK